MLLLLFSIGLFLAGLDGASADFVSFEVDQNVTESTSYEDYCEGYEGECDVQTGPTFTVTNNSDDDGMCAPADCSLRQAILAANGAPNYEGIDRIEFAILGEGPHSIQLNSPLPAMAEAVIIDGYSQLGSQENSLSFGNNASIIHCSGCCRFNACRVCG